MKKMLSLLILISVVLPLALGAVESSSQPARIRMVAHRGAGDLTMPEASRPAYSNAVAMANDIVKLDLQKTRDGVIVMGHDPTLTRNMGWNVKISDVDYVDLLAKGTFLPKGGFDHEKILRLDEALAIVADIPEFWIDFKHYDPEFAERVLAEFKKIGIAESRIMVATGSKGALAYFQQHHPQIRRVGHIFVRPGKTGGLTANCGDAATMDEMVANVIAYRDQYGLYGVNMPVFKRLTRPSQIGALKKAGLWVSLWFVQNKTEADYYRTSGADAFVTDYVSKVRTCP